MPFIVTTKRMREGDATQPGWDTYEDSTSRAFASLKEAGAAAEALVQHIAAKRGDDYLDAGYGEFGNDCFNLTAPGRTEGGKVGPLPDGTFIEVEPVEWCALAEDADEDWWVSLAERGDSTAQGTILTAYNALQEA